MRVVVADATPLHYLILIDAVDVLPRIFEKIYIPTEVRDELSCEATPSVVRPWMQQPTHWLEIFASPVDPSEDSALHNMQSTPTRKSVQKHILRYNKSRSGTSHANLSLQSRNALFS